MTMVAKTGLLIETRVIHMAAPESFRCGSGGSSRDDGTCP